MNENVTNKTPKRRRWIARLLVSALCILLASSLLFVGVAADFGVLSLVSSSFVILPSATSICVPLDFDFFVFMVSNTLYFYRGDFLISQYYIPDSVSGYIPPSGTDNGTYALAFDDLNSILYAVSQYGTQFRIITLVIRDYQVVSSSFAAYGGLQFIEYFVPPLAVHNRHLYFIDNYNNFYHFYNGDLDNLGSVSNTSWVGSAALRFAGSCYVDGYCYFPDASVIVDVNGDYSAVCPQHPIFAVDGLACYVLGNFIRSIDPVSGSPSAIYEFYDFSWPGHIFGFSNSSTLTLITRESGTKTYHSGLFTFPSSPPESSDETTTEPPPESSEESSAGGVIDLYSYDRLSDGTYESALIGTLDLTDATGLRVFLGMYLLGDNVWSDIKTPLTLLVYREDGSLDTYTYDYYAAGFAWGGGSPGSFTFPKFIGGYFDIPLSSSSELYFASSAPGGTIWLQNNSVVLRQINLLNSDSYVELENVSAEECIISVYDSPSDEDPESYVYTSGVLKYTLRKRNSSSSIPVSLDYGETGIVHGVMKYNGADFTVSSIILASDPDLMPPIYDFESMDNALSEAYDDVSRQQYLENLLTSYIENAYGTVSYDPDTSGAFLGGVDLMGDIVDSSGGSTIISAFVNMWSIHPFFSAMVGLLGTFLIFSFFLRKA